LSGPGHIAYISKLAASLIAVSFAIPAIPTFEMCGIDATQSAVSTRPEITETALAVEPLLENR
jgi:hypothetical protein